MTIFKQIRTNARQNRKTIITHLENHFLIRRNGQASTFPNKHICLFCAETSNITKEHILPRWAFEKHPNKFFKTTINGLQHKYNQTTLPVCATCNNSILSKVETEVLRLFSTHKLPDKFFEDQELSIIIRWLELLDYKFQVFSLATRFRAVAGKGQIPFLSDYSLAVLDPNIEYSPAKVMANLRKSLHRITVKAKYTRLNSLVVFKSTNPGINFFHKSNDYVFLELPQFKIAMFYFFEETFQDVYSARDKAMKLIKTHY